MRTVTYKLIDSNKTICLGKVDENNATQVRFDAGNVFDEYPTAVPTLSIVNPEGVTYPGIVERDEDMVTWNVQNSDVAAEGTGEIQLAFTSGNTVVRSYIYTTRINRSIVSDNVPDPVDDWLTAAGAALYEIEHITASASGLPAGSDPTASYEDGVITFGIPQGAQGDPGQDGQDGEDGVSPTVAVTTITGGHTVTITDAEGDHAFNVMDGSAGAVIDDTSTAADKVWSASKTNELKSSIQQKPDILDSDAEDVDLDLTDTDGNVILRLESGHIKTKNFDSSEAGNNDASVKSSDAAGVDLDLTDNSGNVILRLKDGHIKTKKFDSTDMLESPESAGAAGQVLGLNSSLETEWQDAKTALDLFIDNVDVDYRFDETSNANYTVIRVYKNTIHGGKQYPFVFAPNGAEAAGNRNKSTYEMNTEYGFVLALNAGIFDQSTGKPDGVLIMNGESFQTGASTTHSQCKPLWIDEDGDLHSAAYDTSSADLISQGCVSAVCGFMPIIVDYDPVPSSEWNNVEHYYQNAQRQIIGQFGNGDYAIVTCEGRNYQNSDGWTIAEAQTICQEIGLKFAYNLDGGGSTELMLGMKHVNTIYDGVYGRKVPTFIVFNGTEVPPANPTV